MDQRPPRVIQGVVVGQHQTYPTAAPEAGMAGHSGPSAYPPAPFAPTAYPSAPPLATMPGVDGPVMMCKDPRLPVEIRLGFVKKVYGILFAMLILTFGITTPFIFITDLTLKFFRANLWLLYLVMGILLVQYIFNGCMLCEMCCGGTSLLNGYMRMMKTAPWNYIYLFIFAGCFGVLVGFLCAQYTVTSVLLVFGLSAILILALTVYAVRTKADFTGCGAYIMVMLLGVLFLVVIGLFVPGGTVLHRIISAAAATVFGVIIVYNTQQIFGSASEAFGGAARKFEFSIDMYAFAAFTLYLDYINFFIWLLSLLGTRRE